VHFLFLLLPALIKIVLLNPEKQWKKGIPRKMVGDVKVVQVLRFNYCTLKQTVTAAADSEVLQAGRASVM